jgi:hypothetical protein
MVRPSETGAELATLSHDASATPTYKSGLQPRSVGTDTSTHVQRSVLRQGILECDPPNQAGVTGCRVSCR